MNLGDENRRFSEHLTLCPQLYFAWTISTFSVCSSFSSFHFQPAAIFFATRIFRNKVNEWSWSVKWALFRRAVHTPGSIGSRCPPSCFLRLPAGLTEGPTRPPSRDPSAGPWRKLLSSAGHLPLCGSYVRASERCIIHVYSTYTYVRAAGSARASGSLKGWLAERVLTRALAIHPDDGSRRRQPPRRHAGGAFLRGESWSERDRGNGFCSAALCARD